MPLTICRGFLFTLFVQLHLSEVKLAWHSFLLFSTLWLFGPFLNHPILLLSALRLSHVILDSTKEILVMKWGFHMEQHALWQKKCWKDKENTLSRGCSITSVSTTLVFWKLSHYTKMFWRKNPSFFKVQLKLKFWVPYQPTTSATVGRDSIRATKLGPRVKPEI